MDTCHYCGNQYHPMPVYVLDPTLEQSRNWHKKHPGELRFQRIHVCHMKAIPIKDATGKTVDWNFDNDWHECRDKAEADGYKYRRDLTPRR